MLKIAELAGHWTRSMIAWPDGRCDETSSVTWLQSHAIFADLRQPAQLAARLSGARSLGELTMADCMALASQQGFAGVFMRRPEGFEWVRLIDYQPRSSQRDIGNLFWQGHVLVEEGVETEYTEHWHRTAPAQPCAALALRDMEDGRWGCLLQVGPTFMLARERACGASGLRLAEAVAEAASLEDARALVDFEISLGTVSAGRRITRSTLPFRVDTEISWRPEGEARLTLHTGETSTRWEILSTEGDVFLLFNPSGAKI
jgi:hypothetical protein